MATWLIRAGARSRLAGHFEEAGIVALGWPNIPGLADLRDLTSDDVRDLLTGHVGSPATDARKLLSFRDDVTHEDLVVTPDARRNEVMVGRVTGAYEYRDPSPADDHRHVRAVEWLTRVERTQLPPDLTPELRWRRTIRRLTHDDVWLALAGDGVTLDEVRALALSLPRVTEGNVRGSIRFRVGRIVWLAFSRDERLMGFAFPKEERPALVDSEPDKFLLPRQSELRYNWVVVRLDALDHEEMREIVLDAWRMVVPARVAAAHLGD